MMRSFVAVSYLVLSTVGFVLSPPCSLFSRRMSIDAVNKKKKTLKTNKRNTRARINSSSLLRKEEAKKMPLARELEIVPLEREMESSFLRYALSTILGRALPDARDGLKPVHRRILFAMRELGLRPNGPYRKCARVVGEVLGKFHPHGDASVYDALVRLAQPFSSACPLIDGHGNFGSVDADPPAAMRYTECRLTHLAFDALLNRADLGTADNKGLPFHGGISVDMISNFDDSDREPIVLPSRLPLLLINGATGIAVGMSTNIPPHNLGEICMAASEIVNSRISKCDSDLSQKLATIVPGPDFPTGGQLIDDGRSLATLYATGQASVTLRAKLHIEPISSKNKKVLIVATEIPYQVTKSDLVAKAAELINAKKLEGIVDLRDESDRDGMRIVFELKKDANPLGVKAALFQLTKLQVSVPANIVAVVSKPDGSSAGTVPKRLSLQAALDLWLDFRFECIRNRVAFQERNKAKRRSIVVALLAAVSMLDQVIALIRNAKNSTEAAPQISTLLGNLDQDQINAVLSLRLSALTRLESDQLQAELSVLDAELAQLRELLSNDDAVYKNILIELDELHVKYALPRRTEIIIESLDAENKVTPAVPNGLSAILVGRNGYVKRVPLAELSRQVRGGRGRALLRDGDLIDHVLTCHDHDTLLCFAETGVAYAVDAFHIPKCGRTAKGTPLAKLIPALPDGPDYANFEKRLQSIVAVSRSEDKENSFLVLLTRNGLLKKTPLAAFRELTARGLVAISLKEQDTLGWAKLCTDDDELVLATRSGNLIKFPALELRETTRQALGSRAIRLRQDDRIAAMDVLSPNQDTVLLVTRHGYGKRVLAQDFERTKRLTTGIKATSFKQPNDTLASICCCTESDDIIIATRRGLIVRQSAQGVSLQKRFSTGVVLQRNTDGEQDPVAELSILPPDLAAASSDEETLQQQEDHELVAL